MECHCERKKGKLLCKATHWTGQQSPPQDRTLHLWPVSQLLYAWRRSRLDRNVPWKFGQYNSKVLFLNLRKRFFHDLYTYHSLQPEILAVQVLDLQNTGQDMFSMFGCKYIFRGRGHCCQYNIVCTCVSISSVLYCFAMLSELPLTQDTLKWVN